MAKTYREVVGVYREISKQYAEADGIYREISKGYTDVGGVWREYFSSGTPLGELPLGSNMYVDIDGVPTAFAVAQQDSDKTYFVLNERSDSWKMQYDDNNSYSYYFSSIRAYLTEILLNHFDSRLVEMMIPHTITDHYDNVCSDKLYLPSPSLSLYYSSSDAFIECYSWCSDAYVNYDSWIRVRVLYLRDDGGRQYEDSGPARYSIYNTPSTYCRPVFCLPNDILTDEAQKIILE